MSDEQDNYTVGGFREYQSDNLARDPDEVLPHSGFVRDEQLDRQMTVRALHHDPDRWTSKAPADYLGVQKNLDILRAEGGHTARQALENGDSLTLKHYIGDPSQEADLAGLKAKMRLEQIVDGPAPVIVVLGEMGAGKSDFAGLLGQLRAHVVDQDLLVGSNIRTLSRNDEWVREDGTVDDGYIPNYPLLTEWVQQDGNPVENPQQPKLFIGDEFSSHGSGTGEDGHKVRKLMGPLVFKIRKYGGALIYIGHDESSIHPMLWRVGTIIKKTSKKEAIVADRISNGKLVDVESRPLRGIPQTDWSMATKEASEWSWEAPSGEETADTGIDDTDVKRVAMWTMQACREQGMSPRETAEFVPYSHTTVNNWLNEYDEGGEKREWVSSVEAAIA
ncbi:helix-turn-helix domain-containing protein [Natronoarchaeum rubrum]|uniref:helix-turn-helix domain-containing protein n=1 Tax=Natronoarchaeum rubrum TaxID=755311 RepID=UPI002111C428|nr:helix-turn-helix domain-containing protein [Natronoarchaeum rubrum]